MGALLKLENVSKRYDENRAVLAGVDLTVAAGERVAIVGESGCGKSTLLNIIGTLDRPDTGTLEFDGTDLLAMDERATAAFRNRKIGFVFQAYNLLPVLTAHRNVELPLLLTSFSAKERARRAAIALDIVGLADRAKHYPRELSGGQEQRVAIARAIVSDPSLLLCDEPTGDLDRVTADEILRLLQVLNREHGKTIVMVTHDAVAAEFANRTLHCDKGTLEAKEAA